ncbi:MAG: glutamine synthetase III [Eubacteriales bacterium]|nr:glutamine synthetase III [Eubacteriales bacterium]
MKTNVKEIFGSNVFNDAVMKERLPKSAYKKMKAMIEAGADLDPEVADIIAHEMKEWAIEKGATHYSHWFQPLTGITAEKHDAFIDPQSDGTTLLRFSGKELVKGEPDASSFPSGGLRATFEARGYTAWDCTSPAFIKETPHSTILCIPTAFCSYKGEALDKKTPLLRSMQALDVQACRILRLFGKNVKHVTPSVGAEQEYFLVDKKKFLKRKDLIFTGRTLFGAMPPKGQEMDDHYFGTIPEHILEFMEKFNEELWKLGISAKTQHNEVAPAQHEIAPIYDQNNIATDHNQLVMETAQRVADEVGLRCLLHEKPFNGINGSGKHDNWSMCTDKGENLLDPGKRPHENMQFLLFLVAILRAVDEYAGLLRVSASTPGNDHRLGANEAPPAIISVFLGEQLEDVVEQLIDSGTATSSLVGEKYDPGVSSLPTFRKDATDRNRTSPFAFTGNKFEFRMVGSTQSISDPNVVLNTIVAEVLCDMADELEKATDFKMALHDIIKNTISAHKRIIFNGNGYADEWIEEAERRGLPNIKCMVDAVGEFVTPKSIAVFEKHGVFTAAELESRAEIMYETYAKTIHIEALTMIDMAKKQIIPATIKYQTSLAESINELNACGLDIDISVQTTLIEAVTKNLKAMHKALIKLEEVTKEAESKETGEVQARYYRDVVFATMAELRAPADELEMLVEKDSWPIPSYGDLIFEV